MKESMVYVAIVMAALMIFAIVEAIRPPKR